MFYTKGLCQVLWEPRTWVALKSQAGRSTLSSACSYSGLKLAPTVLIDVKARGGPAGPSSPSVGGSRSSRSRSSMSNIEPQQQQLKGNGVRAFASLAAGQEMVARTPSEVEITVAEDEQVPVILPTNKSSDRLLRIRHTVRTSGPFCCSLCCRMWF